MATSPVPVVFGDGVARQAVVLLQGYLRLELCRRHELTFMGGEEVQLRQGLAGPH